MIRTVAVVVPAANEEHDIGACLSALDAARVHLHRCSIRPVHVRVLVVLDTCTDGTEQIVSAHPGVERRREAFGSVGAARAAGAQRIMETSVLARQELWIANTDADSTVPPHWLTAMVEQADRGAHLILGTVLPASGLPAATLRAWHDRHVLREGHPHVHGANFGIRSDVYAALGGWPVLATGEDVRLAAMASSAGHLRIVRTASMAVRTSTRRTARAPSGFSRYLRGLHAEVRSASPCEARVDAVAEVTAEPVSAQPV